MDTQAYTQGFLDLVDGSIAFANDSAYAILVGDGYSFSAAHTTYADVSTHEITDEDYEPQALSGKSVSLSGGDVVYDCSDISFGEEVEINAAGGALIILAGAAASPSSSDRLLFHWALPSPGASLNAPFKVNTPSGLYKITINAA